jgi:tetratricopeptide (TPR) repeat protein
MNADSKGSRIPSGLKYLLLPGAAALIIIGVEIAGSDALSTSADAAEWQAAGYGPSSFAAAVDITDAQLALGRERVANGPDEWLRHESLARALMTRSALSATYDQLYEAKQVLAAAQRRAPDNTGPMLTDAALAMMTHRLDDAERALGALQNDAVIDPAESAEAVAIAGDLQFYRGNMTAAAEQYRLVESMAGPAAAAFRKAIVAKAAGRFDDAIALLRASNPSPERTTPLQHASLAVRIGGVEMARGDYAAARTWFERADRQFPGYWLFQAHVAQAKALDGDLSEAIVDLRGIARRSNSPEVMDALAIYLQEAGNLQESRKWAARAAGIWKLRLMQLPEAAFGHAFEHELAFGTPERLLELARSNVRARPYGEARIMLAESLLLNDQPAAALTELGLAETSGWRSAPLYSLRADALENLGRMEEAKAARQMSSELNPRFEEASTGLVRFSHP